MSESTHFLDIRIGIDYSKVLSPENLSGVKFILGVESDEAVISKYGEEVFKKIEAAIAGRSDVSIENVQLTLAEEQQQNNNVEIGGLNSNNEPIEEEEHLEITPGITSLKEADEVFESVIKRVEEIPGNSNEEPETLKNLSELEEIGFATEEDGEPQDFELFLGLLNSINESLFEVNSAMGEVQKLRVSTDVYRPAEIAQNTGVNEDLIEVGSDIDTDFEIEYDDITDGLKTIKPTNNLGGN